MSIVAVLCGVFVRYYVAVRVNHSYFMGDSVFCCCRRRRRFCYVIFAYNMWGGLMEILNYFIASFFLFAHLLSLSLTHYLLLCLALSLSRSVFIPCTSFDDTNDKRIMFREIYSPKQQIYARCTDIQNEINNKRYYCWSHFVIVGKHFFTGHGNQHWPIRRTK